MTETVTTSPDLFIFDWFLYVMCEDYQDAVDAEMTRQCYQANPRSFEELSE